MFGKVPPVISNVIARVCGAGCKDANVDFGCLDTSIQGMGRTGNPCSNRHDVLPARAMLTVVAQHQSNRAFGHLRISAENSFVVSFVKLRPLQELERPANPARSNMT